MTKVPCYCIFVLHLLVFGSLRGQGALFKQQSVSVEELSADICRWKSDVLKTNNCPRSESLRANMLV